MKRRTIKPPTDASYGLLELAARAAGVSLFGIMDPAHQVRAARFIVGQKKREPKRRKRSG